MSFLEKDQDQCESMLGEGEEEVVACGVVGWREIIIN